MGFRTFLLRHFKFFDTVLLRRQNQVFKSMNFSREKALDKLNIILKPLFGVIYNETKGMWSEHLLILSAISLDETKRVHKILEIGTFRGETTLILSKLFSNAMITTIDLPDYILSRNGVYSYEFSNQKYIRTRNENLRQANASFLAMNSLELISFNDSFDLVWLDGDHNFPTVISDFLNALRLSLPNTLIICDDVIKRKFIQKNTSSLLHKLLIDFQNNGIIEFRLVPKRIGTYNSIFRPKYLAIVTRINF